MLYLARRPTNGAAVLLFGYRRAVAGEPQGSPVMVTYPGRPTLPLCPSGFEWGGSGL
ncbi:hypothetical protein AWB76_04143 [Caballeronia temeraria]|uniref:Uncharacterized protein n=1 Tax=Caballeronia temeraria TaxID=1777137 RepID=A0A158BGI1_9BURK|nr:hypothetical protein AWB76_04143 [Caballeronia temeraria]